MKHLMITMALGLASLLLASTDAIADGSDAPTEKICFGAGKDRGQRFNARISATELTVSDALGSFAGEQGTFQRRGSDVLGYDGVTYQTYLVHVGAGTTQYLVAATLLTPNGEGLIKLRERGDGGYDSHTYFCRNDRFR